MQNSFTDPYVYIYASTVLSLLGFGANLINPELDNFQRGTRLGFGIVVIIWQLYIIFNRVH